MHYIYVARFNLSIVNSHINIKETKCSLCLCLPHACIHMYIPRNKKDSSYSAITYLTTKFIKTCGFIQKLSYELLFWILVCSAAKEEAISQACYILDKLLQFYISFIQYWMMIMMMTRTRTTHKI